MKPSDGEPDNCDKAAMHEAAKRNIVHPDQDMVEVLKLRARAIDLCDELKATLELLYATPQVSDSYFPDVEDSGR